MELDSSLVSNLCLPIGAFNQLPKPAHPAETNDPERSSNSNTSAKVWGRSQLNPCNRLLRLSPTRAPRWRIDGCDSQGTQLQALPVFLEPHLLPLRVDVFIPDQSHHPPGLHDVLDSAAAFCIRDSRAAKLGISQLVLQALEHWTDDHEDFTSAFNALPFGSRIVVENVCIRPTCMRVRMVPDYGTERQLLSVEALQQMWQLPRSAWPRCLDLSDLQHHRQIHDTISLVHIPKLGTGHSFIFKSSVQEVKYLYHELKLLLTMGPHSNIMPAPLFLVSRRDRYGGSDKVYGFILKYHPAGNLGDLLGARVETRTLRLCDQLRWAQEVTRTLIFIDSTPAVFYSELKADNLLLATDPSGTEHVLFIDFEQMGKSGWPHTLCDSAFSNALSTAGSHTLHPRSTISSTFCASRPLTSSPSLPASATPLLQPNTSLAPIIPPSLTRFTQTHRVATTDRGLRSTLPNARLPRSSRSASSYGAFLRAAPTRATRCSRRSGTSLHLRRGALRPRRSTSSSRPSATRRHPCES